MKTTRRSFTGTWKTISGGTHQYTVVLKQTDNKVTGTFSPGNGKIFDGVVNEKRLTFKWTQDGGWEGIGEFTLDEDGKGFTGSSTALKPQEFTNTWNTVKPPVISFAGTWQTISDGQHSISLTMVQVGNKVTGLYPGSNGKIEGAVSGRVLRFKWESSGGRGSGRFVMEEGGRAFNGTYNKGDDPDEVESTWNGKRPISFDGVWKLEGNKCPPTITLKQIGKQITGGFAGAGFPTRTIGESVIVGNTLRVTFFFEDGKRGSTAEIVLDEEGKSIKGQMGLCSFTGTLVEP